MGLQANRWQGDAKRGMFERIITRDFWTAETILALAGGMSAAAGAFCLYFLAGWYQADIDAKDAAIDGNEALFRTAEQVDFQYGALQAQGQVLNFVFDLVADPDQRRTRRLDYLYARSFPITRMIGYAFAEDEGKRVLASYQKEFDAYTRGDDGALTRLSRIESEVVQQTVTARQELLHANADLASAKGDLLETQALVRDIGGGLMILGLTLVFLGSIAARKEPGYPQGL